MKNIALKKGEKFEKALQLKILYLNSLRWSSWRVHTELYRFQIPFKEEFSNLLIFWSTNMLKVGKEKNEILRWPLEIAS